MVSVTPNPIDTIWEDQPKRPTASLSVPPFQFAGQSVAEKLAMISKLLGKAVAVPRCSPNLIRWPGSLTSGATMCPTRQSSWPTPF